MLWYPILTCAVGVICGLSGPVNGIFGEPTEAECLRVGNMATVMVYAERAPEFRVTCELKPEKKTGQEI